MPDLSDLVISLRTLETSAAEIADPLAAQILAKPIDRAQLPLGADQLQRALELTQQTAAQLRKQIGRSAPVRGSAQFAAGQYLKQLRARLNEPADAGVVSVLAGMAS